MRNPFAVIHFARIPAEIKLGNVPMQMRAADVVEGAVDAAPEQRERGFTGVAVRTQGNSAIDRDRRSIGVYCAKSDSFARANSNIR